VTGFSEAGILSPCTPILGFTGAYSLHLYFQHHALGLDKAGYTSDCMT